MISVSIWRINIEGCPDHSGIGCDGEGIDELVATIEAMAENGSRKACFGTCTVCRSTGFYISGFGPVVTGTLWTGQIQ
jgi:selenocysteine-specific translation elongation factor